MQNKVGNEEAAFKEITKEYYSEVELVNKSVIGNKTGGYGKNSSFNEIINMIKKELNISEIDKGVIKDAENNIKKVATDFLIKEQIKLKTEEIKNIVKVLIEIN